MWKLGQFINMIEFTYSLVLLEAGTLQFLPGRSQHASYFKIKKAIVNHFQGDKVDEYGES